MNDKKFVIQALIGGILGIALYFGVLKIMMAIAVRM